MKLKQLIILTIFTIIIVSTITTTMIKTNGIDKISGSVTYHLYEKPKIIKVQEFKVLAMIGNKSGWNMETENLNFGKLQPGGSAGRFMLIKNDYDYSIKVKMKTEGEMKEWLSFTKELTLPPNKGEEIHIGASAPDLPIGNYTGKFIITYYKT